MNEVRLRHELDEGEMQGSARHPIANHRRGGRERAERKMNRRNAGTRYKTRGRLRKQGKLKHRNGEKTREST